MKPAYPVESVIKAIEEKISLSDIERDAIRAAFSSRGKLKGYLLKTLPSRAKGDMCRAAWLGIQPNPFKIGIGSIFFLEGEAKELFDKLSKLRFPAALDYDRRALTQLGVW